MPFSRSAIVSPIGRSAPLPCRRLAAWIDAFVFKTFQRINQVCKLLRVIQRDGCWNVPFLVKYQGDNGWQTKVVPDSRALIKLGLGPNYSAELLNAPPKTASAGPPSTTASRGVEGTAGKQ